MRQLNIITAAEREIAEAVEYYRRKDELLATELAAEFDRAFDLLIQNPFVGAPFKDVYRKYVVDRFPYLIYYELKNEDIYIVAVSHQRRMQDYWMRRRKR